MLTQELMEKTIAFHGHHCPGLTLGMRAGEWCLQELGHATDEEIVTITETDMCAVDAIQFLTGCTFGKGNLVFLDYGKVAFSFFRRSDGKSARLRLNRTITADLKEKRQQLNPDDTTAQDDIRQQMIERMMNAEITDLFFFGPPQMEMPQLARIHKSILCDSCGEDVMEPQLVKQGTERLCPPCAAKMLDG